jgi:hypothetical protein
MSANPRLERRRTRAERRRAVVDRRQPPRPVQCTHCGVLLAFERRDGLVALYRSGSPPYWIAPPEPVDGIAPVPRCAICNAPIAVPGRSDPEDTP